MTLFKAITRDTTLVEQAEDQIKGLILNLSLRPGERLPSERELGQVLGVSRTVVREAIRQLSARGLVEVRTGSGTYVQELGANIMKEPLDLLLRTGALKVEHIHEVRAVIEVRIAELAAANASADDIERMQETIQRVMKRDITPLEYATADVAFHNYLAAATRNPLFLALINSIGDVMLEVRLRAARSLGDTPRERAVIYHSKILDCIRTHDVNGARLAMIEHLEYAAQVMSLVAQSPWESTSSRIPGKPEQQDLRPA